MLKTQKFATRLQLSQRNQIQQLKQCNFVSSRMHNNDEYPVDVIKHYDATNKDQTEWFS